MKSSTVLLRFNPHTLTKFAITVAFSTAAIMLPSMRVGAHEGGEGFPIPEDLTTSEQLYDFLAVIGETEPEGDSEQELMAHHAKTLRTVVAVADKAIPLAQNEEEAVQGFYYKLQGLSLLKDLGEPHADERFEQTLNQALTDQRSDVVSIGMKFKVESGFSKWTGWSEAEKKDWVNTVITHLKSQQPEAHQVQMVSTVLDFLGDNQSEEYATELLDAAIPHFQSASDEGLTTVVPMLEGIQRRMKLPGNEMDLEGMLIDGSQFDWASYRGKVVLVDYWAAWCAPCLMEIPHILKMYNAYHEKGFEVVGISLDNKREEALAIIERSEIPWVTLFSEDETQRGWEHPMAVRYGVTGIPRAILINREGIVVSMNARGAVLEQELRKLLGEPLARAGRDENSVARQTAKPVVAE